MKSKYDYDIPDYGIHDLINAEDIPSIDKCLSAGVDINFLHPLSKYSVLVINILRRNTEIVEYLIKKGADVNIILRDGHNALTLANSDTMVKILVEGGADLSSQFIKDNNLIYFLVYPMSSFECSGDKEDFLVYLFNKGLAVPSDFLCRGLKLSEPKITQLLINYGADVNFAKEQNDNSSTPSCYPLTYCIDRLVIECLLENGANPHLLDSLGRDALQVHYDEQNLDAAQAIREYLAMQSASDLRKELSCEIKSKSTLRFSKKI